MPGTETLSQALDNEGSSDQKNMCTAAVLALTQDQCKQVFEGHEIGLTQADRASFNGLCKHRITNGQSILPWPGLQLNIHPDIFPW